MTQISVYPRLNSFKCKEGALDFLPLDRRKLLPAKTHAIVSPRDYHHVVRSQRVCKFERRQMFVARNATLLHQRDQTLVKLNVRIIASIRSRMVQPSPCPGPDPFAVENE